jgi:hypothetical protein
MMRFSFLRPLLGMLCALVWTSNATGTARAEEALLTIVDRANGVRTELTRIDLDALPQHQIETHTDFTNGLTVFRGARVTDALALAGIVATEELQMVAANDYAVRVPFSDFVSYGVLLATEMNGEQLTLRNRGPIWLMYPLDTYPELNSSTYNDRLIWQLVRIETH